MSAWEHLIQEYRKISSLENFSPDSIMALFSFLIKVQHCSFDFKLRVALFCVPSLLKTQPLHTETKLQTGKRHGHGLFAIREDEIGIKW